MACVLGRESFQNICALHCYLYALQGYPKHRSQFSGIEDMKLTALNLSAVLSFEQHLHQIAAYRRDGAINEEISVTKEKNSALKMADQNDMQPTNTPKNS